MRDHEQAYGGNGRGRTDRNAGGDGEKRSRYAGKRWNNGADANAERGDAYRKPGEQRGGYAKRGSDNRDFEKNGYAKRSDNRGYNNRGYDNRSADGRDAGSRAEGRSDFAKRGDNRGYENRGDNRGYENRCDNRDFERNGYAKRGDNRGDNRGYDKRAAYGRDGAKPASGQEADPAAQAGGADELPFLLIGRNAVREAVKSGRSIDRILVSSEQDGSLKEIVRLARDQKLVIREVERRKLDELCMPFGHGGKTANHQGIVAYAAGMEYCSIADILSAAKERGEEPFVIVLDGVEDPHNLGSIIRSAECAGAHGVIIGKRRSASVTAAAVKAAAGATAYMRVARVVNVSGALEELKRAGLWVAGADMDGTPMDKQGLNGALALVIGGEGGGLTKLVKETCDFLVSIPMRGQINSLNASVAAAVLMFEKRRQDAVEP
ncbi:MAG: 23S rRNA (guanosine(2251)-2'-O)-methyltransferase RlmB [Candidatus Aphodomorpha sp.]